MAYNPFNIFRRNQKALFAVLTVFIMIMFTLSFGANDFFERTARWMGSRGKGEAVCKLDGSTIKDGELERVRRERVMANVFMSLGAAQTVSSVREYAIQQQGRLSEEGRRQLSALGGYFSLLEDPQSRGNFQLQQFVIQQVQSSTSAILASPTAKSEDKDVARAYQAMLALASHRGEGDHYFLNAPNRTHRDRIEFLLWEKKADQLGIHFTADDVKVLLNREFYNYWNAQSDVQVRKVLAQNREGFNMDACLKALAVEFKVRAAQVALLGPVAKSRPAAAPVYGTPYEMFDYYREQCSPATYEVLAIPSLAFTDKVVGEPTEAELNDLFRKHANDEPNPAKETFGFMTPRRLSVSWVALTGTEPYYEKLAAEQVKVGEALAKASGMLTVPLPGAGGGWAAAATLPLALKEPAVEAEYASYTRGFESKYRERFGTYARADLPAADLLPTNVVRPATLAATLGAMIGQTAPFGSPAAATALAMGPPIGYEVRDRVKTGLPLLLGALPGPAQFQTAVAGAAHFRQTEPKPLPIEAMRPELLKTTVTARAKALALGDSLRGEKGDLAKFVEEVNKLSDNGKAKDKAAVEKYVTEFRTARGLTTAGVNFGATTAPRDEWTLEEDPGMLPLVFAQKGEPAGLFGAQKPYLPFGRRFFWTFASGRRVATTGTYIAQPFAMSERNPMRDDGRASYVYWVTKEEAAVKPDPYSAKERLRAAWKQMKARELAQARAHAIAEAIRKSPASSPDTIRQAVVDEAFKFQTEVIANKKAYDRATPFVLDNVCPFAPLDPSRRRPEEMIEAIQRGINVRDQVEPFGLPESANIPYPTREMATALIENRDKPAKTVVVLPDAPKDTYYVAVLLKRDLKNVEDFKRSAYAPGAPAAGILGNFQGEEAQKARQAVVELLKKEFRYTETDDQKKKLDDNAKSGGRD